ncbi:hypothetical protein V8C37DRAFT_369801 [Trichoderma ceciliae]
MSHCLKFVTFFFFLFISCVALCFITSLQNACSVLGSYEDYSILKSAQLIHKSFISPVLPPLSQQQICGTLHTHTHTHTHVTILRRNRIRTYKKCLHTHHDISAFQTPCGVFPVFLFYISK